MYDLEDDGLPLGLSMQLAQDEDAMSYFFTLPESEREHLIEYIKQAKTGDEARKRIDEVVELCKKREKLY